MNLEELKAQKTAVVARLREIDSKAEAEERDLSDAERTEIKKGEADLERLNRDIDRADRKALIEKYEAELKQVEGRKTAPTPAVRSSRTGELKREQAGEFLRAWGLMASKRQEVDADTIYRAADHGFNLNQDVIEYRALSKGTNSAGGYTVPQSFASELEKILAYYFPVASAFDVFPTDDGRDYPYPTVTRAGAAGVSNVAENGAIPATAQPTFGQVVFKSFDYFSDIVKVPYQLMRDSARDIPSLLAELFAEDMGEKMDSLCVSTADGTSSPEGCLNGVSVGANLASGNAITVQKLLDLESSVPLAYRNLPGVGWLMHDATWQAIRAIADTTGRLMVHHDLQNGTEKKLLGYPVFLSNNVTSISSPGDNQPIALFGALKKYKIRRIGGATLTRYNELFAGNGQTGFSLHECWDARWITKAGVRTLNSYDAP